MATIDPSWVELQTGLYLEEYQQTIGGTNYTFRRLHSSDGYCFKDMTDEVEDESQRPYYTYMALAIQASSWTYEQLNARFISVPIDPSYEIVSVTTPNVDI